jgi:3-oxoacyl-[acyl-carrier protein] reductase
VSDVAIVTGASGQIGSAIAGELERRGLRLARFAADVTSDAAVDDAVARIVAELGVPVACVNTAGVEGIVAPLEEIPLADVQRVFDVNVFGIFRTSRALLPHFKARGSGRIVNIASGAGLGGVPKLSAYAASKHAVIGLTRSLAIEAAADGVSVNAVCPGCVESPMMERIEDALGADFRGAIPMHRYAEADEVASLVAYLVCDAPPYLTGATLSVDGGLRA